VSRRFKRRVQPRVTVDRELNRRRPHHRPATRSSTARCAASSSHGDGAEKLRNRRSNNATAQPSEISDLIRSKIENLSLAADVRTQGTVVTVTDGICRIHGLSDVMQGEMLEIPNNTFASPLNLERDSVGFGDSGEYQHISEGDTVKCTGAFSRCRSGRELLGRV